MGDVPDGTNILGSLTRDNLWRQSVNLGKIQLFEVLNRKTFLFCESVARAIIYVAMIFFLSSSYFDSISLISFFYSIFNIINYKIYY